MYTSSPINETCFRWPVSVVQQSCLAPGLALLRPVIPVPADLFMYTAKPAQDTLCLPHSLSFDGLYSCENSWSIFLSTSNQILPSQCSLNMRTHIIYPWFLWEPSTPISVCGLEDVLLCSFSTCKWSEDWGLVCAVFPDSKGVSGVVVFCLQGWKPFLTVL